MINVTFSDSAKEQVNKILRENSATYLRIFVTGGGCSGLQYGFELTDTKNEDDFESDSVIIDSLSYNYVNGANIDYVSGLEGSHFTFSNPNATTQCGCGSSFGV